MTFTGEPHTGDKRFKKLYIHLVRGSCDQVEEKSTERFIQIPLDDPTMVSEQRSN